MSNQAPLEERLRAALEARGQLISAHDLSPSRPPSGRVWGTRRMRRVLSMAGAAIAAAAAAIVIVLSFNTSDHSRPAPPARQSDPSVTPSANTPPTEPSAIPSLP
ncbi:hypothetical protein ACWEQ2_33545 [Streptomyces sp. NPDC004096]|uniref:hypothetical protein n=1 Tax=unclassified Streptomyces TaxID=2593676 RepID=UPI0033B5E655